MLLGGSLPPIFSLLCNLLTFDIPSCQGIPQQLEDGVVQAVFTGFFKVYVKDLEVVKNPDGARRSCAVVEFTTVDETRKVLESFTTVVEEKKTILSGLGLQPSSLYIRHMPNMVFPGPPGDCCSMRHIKRTEVDPPSDWAQDQDE